MNVRRARTALLAPTLLVAGLPFAVAPPAHANPDILVGCTPLGLVLAFELANDESKYPGGDTIVLSSGCTYSLTERYGDTEDALPRIPSSSAITVRGNGAIIERAAGAPSFGLTDVSGDLLMQNLTMREFWGFNGAYLWVSGSAVLSDVTITNTPPTGQQEASVEVSAAGTLAMIDSVVENQFDVDGGAGGAINNEGYAVVQDSTFRNNTVRLISGGIGVQVGGAISNSGTMFVYDSTFDSNHARATGGAIRNSGVLEVHGSSFTGNSANFGGAIDNNGSADLIVTGSYFGENEAAIDGGALDNGSSGLAQVEDSTFWRNEAGSDGGAVANALGVRLEQVTMAENDADTGDSVYSSAGAVSLEASVLGSSSSHCAGSVLDFGDNVVHPSAGTCGADFTVGDPKLLAPALRGGDTKTMALGAGSAAFDAGGSSCDSSDQRGFTRPRGAACDAGALENQPPTAPGAPTLAAGHVSPNRGSFGLTWTPGTDPDGTPLSWVLTEQRSDQHAFASVGTTTTNARQFAGHPEGVWRFRVTASDGNLASGSSPTSSAVKVDQTAPTLPVPATDRTAEYADDGGWFADQVSVSFDGSTDPDLVDGSAGSGVASYSLPQVFATSGLHTATGTATDGAGNVSAAAALSVQVDATPPVVGFDSCPSAVVLGSSAQAAWSASDAHSGLATPATGTIALDTSTIATRTVTATADDNVGHASSATCTFDVVYAFTGFSKPLLNPPSTATVRAGDTVQVSWSLSGFQGLGVLEAGFPASAPITCGTSPSLTTGTPTTSRRGLQYLASPTGRYTYGWTTSTAWAGTCRQLVVLLDDGTYHRANVRFS
ncbi:PxKF domain-containing protein [Nocardioides sp.]|uniref:PxKF domain-containing protein n=1 Tax=Nocardioides sp. TaxID=35761 RepID=UPI002D13B480|nr:PxKF domain-containing protein [Nocardioides sp.]HSX69184.1 PxKF domain-containing protein [Nocardioides sp.]